MSIADHQAIQVKKGHAESTREKLVVEEPLQICINGKAFSITMRTPGADRELVIGLLYAEGVVQPEGLSSPISIEQMEGYTEANVTVPDIFVCENLLEKRSLLANASCGFCGKREITDIPVGMVPLKPASRMDTGKIPAMLAGVRKGQVIFSETGGCHAAAVFDTTGNLLVLHEDVGRHNAVDKVIGHLVTQDLLENTNVLFVSGRISYEIISKAYAARIAHICAVSAPSSMAINMADVLGISVLAFCREGRFTVYTHPQQVMLPTQSHVGS